MVKLIENPNTWCSLLLARKQKLITKIWWEHLGSRIFFLSDADMFVAINNALNQEGREKIQIGFVESSPGK